MLIRRLLGLATVLVVVAAGGWNAWSFHRGGPVHVTTASVSAGSIVRRIVATGTLQAVTMVQVGSQVSGSIESLHADYNTIVHKGQVLAKLDPASFEAEVREADAALRQAKANMIGFEVAIEDARPAAHRSPR